MKKLLSKLSLLALFCLTTVALSAQTYNGGTWYSLYDASERTLKTSTWFENKEIYNYTGVLAPSTGVLTFDTKMTKHMGVTNPDSYEISVNGTKVSVPAKQTNYLNRSVNVSTDANSVSFVYIFFFQPLNQFFNGTSAMAYLVLLFGRHFFVRYQA